MPKVVCDECETKFSIADGASAKCPVCGKKHKAKPAAGDGKAKGAKCPMCKQTLPPHVKFCAKCGVDVGESNAAVAGLIADNELEKYKNRQAWQRFWRRFIPWW
ncbi:MAG TPA: hypothetical protein VFG20_17905 [Planctomycetaceae bacterium]|nr:hypothetical protein [Planctomycetaceae bacterium]